MMARSWHNSSRVFSVTLILGAIATSAWATDTSPKTFTADYLKGLQSLEAKFANCSGDYVASTFRPGVAVTRTRGLFAFSQGAGRLVETAIDRGDQQKVSADPQVKKTDPKYETVTVYNQKNSFSLVKSNARSDYAIGMFEAGPSKGQQMLAPGFRNPTNFFTHASVTSIASIVGSPTFRVEKWSESDRVGNDRRVRVDFTRSVEVTKDNARGSHITSGWFILAPEEGWLLHEYGVVKTLSARPSAQGTTVGHYEYSRGPEGELRPVKYLVQMYNKRFDEDPAASSVSPSSSVGFEFTGFRFGETPPREFTLAAFGLPEFGEPAAKRLDRPYPWWIVAAAAGVGGLAFALRRLANRPRPPKSESVA